MALPAQRRPPAPTRRLALRRSPTAPGGSPREARCRRARTRGAGRAPTRRERHGSEQALDPLGLRLGVRRIKQVWIDGSGLLQDAFAVAEGLEGRAAVIG